MVKIISEFCGYWLCVYVILDLILEQQKQHIHFKFKANLLLLERLGQVKWYKDKLPSVSRFKKKHLQAATIEYLQAYLEELRKALLMHTLPLIAVFTFVFNWQLFVINLGFIIIFNLPFIIVIIYNGVRVQNLLNLKLERESYEKN